MPPLCTACASESWPIQHAASHYGRCNVQRGRAECKMPEPPRHWRPGIPAAMTEFAMDERLQAATARDVAPRRTWVRPILVAAAAVVLLAALRILPATDWLVAFVGWIRGAGISGMVLFALAYVVACVV